LNLEPWFIPLFSGTFRASGLNQKRVVQTRNFRSGPLFCGPDQIKVVQTRKNWYFQTAQKTSPTWFRPLFLVQTGKTWPIPIFFRLPRYLAVYKAPRHDDASALHNLMALGPVAPAQRAHERAARRDRACGVV
jgi:hypothetical protein